MARYGSVCYDMLYRYFKKGKVFYLVVDPRNESVNAQSGLQLCFGWHVCQLCKDSVMREHYTRYYIILHNIICIMYIMYNAFYTVHVIIFIWIYK